MNFQSIPVVEKPDFYLDVAFRKGKVKASQLPKLQQKDRLVVLVRTETTRIDAAGRELQRQLNRILTSFPSFDALPPFYNALVRATMDYGEVKRSLGGIQWSSRRIGEFTAKYVADVRASRSAVDVARHKKAFYGRASSAVKQVKKELENLEAARKLMKRFPHIKTSVQTVVIAGYPNVGKSTLLRALTGSAPKIASYPFTTQRIMLGYCDIGERKFQVVDTPGMLDRPLSSMNHIEKQAALALSYLAAGVVFMLDPTEHAGYSVEKQLSLLRQLQKTFAVPFVVVLSKIDLDALAAANVERQLDSLTVLSISAEKGTGIEELRQALLRFPTP